MDIFCRQQIDIFLIFPRKQDWTFHANCLYSGKNKKKYFNMSAAENFTQSVISVKGTIFFP